MSYDTSFYHGYGVQVVLPDGWHDKHWQSLEEVLLPFGLPVRGLAAGDYDANWEWLFVREATPTGPEIKLGTYAKVDPYAADLERCKQWDAWLVEACETHSLKIKDGPAWFFVPDYS